MNTKTYTPQPIDTTGIELPEELELLVELMPKNVHEVWASTRIQQGWTYGKQRNDELKTHPEELPEEEKEYDRNTSIGTLKLIVKLASQLVINKNKYILWTTTDFSLTLPEKETRDSAHLRTSD